MMNLSFCPVVAIALALTTCTVHAAPILVHGHRGARARYPENTLPAFRHAIAVGTDVLELDIAITKDAVAVLSHDPELDPRQCLDEHGRRLAAPVRVRELTLAQIKRYDCGSLKHPDFPEQINVPGTRIPTLDELFELAARSRGGQNIFFNIETKLDPRHPARTADPVTFVDVLLKTIDRHGLRSRVILQSFDERTLIEIRRRDPSIARSALNGNWFRSSVGLVRRTGAHFISPLQVLATRRFVERFQARGVGVIPYTANSAAQWDRLVNVGVDGIITDDPERLIAYLKARGLR